MLVCLTFSVVLTGPYSKFFLYNLSLHQTIRKMKRDQGYDALIKLLIIGNSGVGKTNLLIRFTQNNFLNSHLTTIGIDFKTKMINMGQSKVKLQIWDTAGQQRFKTITQTYYKGAMGIILTYAIDDRTSYNDIQNWVKQIKMHASNEVVRVLVGNKSDSAKRQVSYEEGKKLASELDMSFFQTSAKDNIYVTEMFLDIGEQAMKKHQVSQHEKGIKSQVGTSRNLIAEDGTFNNKRSKCCG